MDRRLIFMMNKTESFTRTEKEYNDALKQASNIGTILGDENVAVHKVRMAFTQMATGLKGQLEELKGKIERTKESLNKAQQSFDNFLNVNSNRLTIHSIEEAHGAKKKKWIDYIVWPFFFFEAIIGYALFINYLGSGKWYNHVIALVLSIMIALGSFLLKSYAYKYHKWLGNICVIFALLFLVGLIFVAGTSRDVKKYDISKLDTTKLENNLGNSVNYNGPLKKTGEVSLSFDKNELKNLFMLLFLVFASAALPIAFGNPKKEKDAQELLNAAKVKIELERKLEDYHTQYDRLNSTLDSLKNTSSAELELNALTHYMLGLQINKSPSKIEKSKIVSERIAILSEKSAGV